MKRVIGRVKRVDNDKPLGRLLKDNEDSNEFNHEHTIKRNPIVRKLNHQLTHDIKKMIGYINHQPSKSKHQDKIIQPQSFNHWK